ncbi:MAG: hypothetical protein IPF58_02305 [Saprospirales bacterium]|nr:hypothetical protein [Saprospirales bacterium]
MIKICTELKNNCYIYSIVKLKPKKNEKQIKKIAQYSAIALAAAAVLPMACKKETKVADDPNIIHRDLNKTLTLSSTKK